MPTQPLNRSTKPSRSMEGEGEGKDDESFIAPIPASAVAWCSEDENDWIDDISTICTLEELGKAPDTDTTKRPTATRRGQPLCGHPWGVNLSAATRSAARTSEPGNSGRWHWRCACRVNVTENILDTLSSFSLRACRSHSNHRDSACSQTNCSQTCYSTCCSQTWHRARGVSTLPSAPAQHAMAAAHANGFLAGGAPLLTGIARGAASPRPAIDAG
eukprot:NODE_11956_length_1255_cov_4.529255.p1 GENE.NODE_11956_length_1255_cov_4.529255~~NODE_11956_length_1255_cov_4.529255.p1  ORF type:complete len:216 (-),score=9.59 NODE_11956_length_1255_cov_4.529255:161-808(-)